MSWSLQLAETLPELVLSVGAIVLMLIAAWGKQSAARAVSWVSVAVLIGAEIALLGPASSGGVAFDGLYRADAFAGFAKTLIFAAAAVSILIAPRFFARTSGDDLKPEYPVLILLSAAGMGMMVSAGDLLTLYVGLELQSLAAYVLASFMRRDARSAEAGLKYFVLGALASGILLYGISLVYGFTGSTQFDSIASAYGALNGARSYGMLFGLVFVFAGLAFKISAVPFHMWTPDVYEGAPTPVTTFFASAPKVAAIALLTRVAVSAMGPALHDWRQIVIFASLASIVLGAVAAIGQTNIKRLLAYSSINNVGFALVGLAAGGSEGVASVLFYMTIYIVMTLGSFLIVLQMRDADGPACPGCRARGRALRWRWRSSCSVSPAFRRCLGSTPSWQCSWPPSTPGSPGSPRSLRSGPSWAHIITCASSRSCTSTRPGPSSNAIPIRSKAA